MGTLWNPDAGSDSYREEAQKDAANNNYNPPKESSFSECLGSALLGGGVTGLVTEENVKAYDDAFSQASAKK